MLYNLQLKYILGFGGKRKYILGFGGKREHIYCAVTSTILDLDDKPGRRRELRMKRPKLTVRPTEEELTQLHERAGRLGYSSLSAYLIDCALSGYGVLPRERRTLESLLLHVHHLTAVVEEERRHRKSGVLSPVSPELVADVTRRTSEALRLINVILGRAAGGEEMEEGEEAA